MRKNKEQTKLKFNTRQYERTAKATRFAVAFICFFVVLGGISVFLFLRYYDFDLSKVAKTQSEETSSEPVGVSAVENVTGVYNFLLLCTSDVDNEVRFAVVLTVDMDENRFSVSPIFTDQPIAAPDGSSGTLQQMLDEGGVGRLVSALEHTCGKDITKYIRSTDSSFRTVVNTAGGVIVTVDEDIDVRNEKMTFLISRGEQTMNGDTLLKYLRCYEDDAARQAQIISMILSQKIASADLSTADDVYTQMINAVESDISKIDFEQVKQSVAQLRAAGGAAPTE